MLKKKKKGDREAKGKKKEEEKEEKILESNKKILCDSHIDTRFINRKLIVYTREIFDYFFN